MSPNLNARPTSRVLGTIKLGLDHVFGVGSSVKIQGQMLD